MDLSLHGCSAGSGGHSSSVQDQLKNVQQIQASNQAFAAILGDGSVVTWGSVYFGGGSSAVQAQLKNVQQIQASDEASAAILGDGSVVTWGSADYGGAAAVCKTSSTTFNSSKPLRAHLPPSCVTGLSSQNLVVTVAQNRRS